MGISMKQSLNQLLALAAIITGVTGCASYHFGQHKRALPGGYDRVAIPLFSNKTQEVGIETYFTESLRMEFERSRLAKVTSKNDAQVILEGAIVVTGYTGGVAITGGDQTSKEIRTPYPITLPPSGSGAATENTNPLPQGTFLNKEYYTTVTVRIVARKVSDSSVLWEGDFSSQRQFFAPLIGTPGLNTANPLYINTSRQETVARIAKDLMSEAHDRLTENF
jgi:hypothetical protein